MHAHVEMLCSAFALDLFVKPRLTRCRTHVQGQVDIGDLTWEQKEKVLRFLFAKMNHTDPKRPKLPPTSQQPLPPPGETGDAW